MRYFRFGVPALLVLVGIGPSLAQSTDAPEKSSANSVGARHSHRQPACWRQAGIAANLVNQRWKIEDEGRARIAAVCSESSSAQQKQSKIQLINTDTAQAISNLIPAKQLQVYNACQAELEKSHPKPENEKELGPCGGVIPNSTPGSDSLGMDH